MTPAMDSTLLALLHDWRHPALTAGLGAVTWLGSLAVLLPLALFAAWRQARPAGWRRRAFLPAAVLGAAAIAWLLKWAVERARPDLFPSLVAMPADPSFPSAHAMQAAAFVSGWLLWSGGVRRPALVAAGTLLVLAVGLSRLYLQVHFPTDVLFGVAAGVGWAVWLHALPFWQRGR